MGPGDIANSDKVLAFIAREISRDSYVNVMGQYYPCYGAREYPPLDRPLTGEGYRHALALAEQHGLRRLDQPRWLNLH